MLAIKPIPMLEISRWVLTTIWKELFVVKKYHLERIKFILKSDCIHLSPSHNEIYPALRIVSLLHISC